MHFTWFEHPPFKQLFRESRFSPAFQFFQALIIKIREDDCMGLAAEMAYSLLLAIIPTLIFLFSLIGVIGRQADTFTLLFSNLQQIVPPHATTLLTQTLVGVIESSSNGLTLFGFLLAFWSASNGARVLIKGLNRAYHIPAEHQSFWYLRLLSMIVLLALGLMILLMANLIIFWSLLLEWLGHFLSLSWNELLIINGSRWLIVILSMTFLGTFIYALPLRRRIHRLDWLGCLPGALVFLMLWITFSLLFSFYIVNLGEFNPVYGVLAAVVLLMTWLYFSALAVFIGAEVVALNTQQPQNS